MVDPGWGYARASTRERGFQVAGEEVERLGVWVREFGKVLRADDRLVHGGDLPTTFVERLRRDGGGVEPVGEVPNRLLQAQSRVAGAVSGSAGFDHLPPPIQLGQRRRIGDRDPQRAVERLRIGEIILVHT
ncbi:hypothetical protein [Rhodococcus jostii]|uniref:hypothetical protein n=1 Tax=Rhodococcus jostii TaxID=132919 RepID=UPI00365DD4D4